MRVLIVKKSFGWELIMRSSNNKVNRSWSFFKLVDALNMANTLKVHVDNIDALPLAQYKMEET